MHSIDYDSGASAGRLEPVGQLGPLLPRRASSFKSAPVPALSGLHLAGFLLLIRGGGVRTRMYHTLTVASGQVECEEGSLLMVNTRLLLHHTQLPPGQDCISLSYAREFDLYPEAPGLLAGTLSLPALGHQRPPSRGACQPQTRHHWPSAKIPHAAQALEAPAAEAAAKRPLQTRFGVQHSQGDAGVASFIRVASAASVASRVAAGEGKAAPVLDALVLQGNVISRRSICAFCRTPTALDLHPPSPLRYANPARSRFAPRRQPLPPTISPPPLPRSCPGRVCGGSGGRGTNRLLCVCGEWGAGKCAEARVCGCATGSSSESPATTVLQSYFSTVLQSYSHRRAVPANWGHREVSMRVTVHFGDVEAWPLTPLAVLSDSKQRQQRECHCLCCSVKRSARHALALAVNTRCVLARQHRACLISPCARALASMQIACSRRRSESLRAE